MTIETLFLGLLIAATPASQPTSRPTPEWLKDPANWRGFAREGREYVNKSSSSHLQRWQQYRTLAMTPVDEGAEFGQQLLESLQREAVYAPNVPPLDAALKEPVPTTRPAAPDGPMTEAMFESLTVAVQDAWTVLQDRPFETQREKYFKGRVTRIEHAAAESAYISDKLGEPVDASKLTGDEVWSVLRRLYDKRRAAFDGGFNLTGVALDSPRGIACQIFYRSTGRAYTDGFLLARGNANGTGWDDYWRAGLLVCARQLTHPPITQDQVMKRDGRVLRADIQVILELQNGERAPMVMSTFYNPREKRWWVMTTCFTSSPFISVVGQTR